MIAFLSVRYDGNDLSAEGTILQEWINEGRVGLFCPEVSAGLPTPRPAAE